MTEEPVEVPITEDGKITKIVLKSGGGEIPTNGQRVEVHYLGKIADTGVEFDNTRKRMKPFQFTIGQGVIKGWTEAVKTMRVGEWSQFRINSEYAYGQKGMGRLIPPNTDLIYEIELLQIFSKYTGERDALDDIRPLCDQAAVQFQGGNFVEAIELYKQGLNIAKDFKGKLIDPEKVRINRNLSVCYAKLGEWSFSLQYAQAVLAVDPNDLKALLRKLEAYISLGDAEEARKTYDYAIKKSNRNPAFLAFQERLFEVERAARIEADELLRKMVG